MNQVLYFDYKIMLPEIFRQVCLKNFTLPLKISELQFEI